MRLRWLAILAAAFLAGACGDTERAVTTDTTVAGLAPEVIQFRSVLTLCPPEQTPTATDVAPCLTDDPFTDTLPEDEVFVERDGAGEVVMSYRLGPVLVDGSSLETARVTSQSGSWAIEIVFREGSDGIDRFNAAATPCHSQTDACPTGQLAIVSDGVVISAPRVQQAVFERDQIQISGDLDEASANALVEHLLGR